MQCLVCGPSEGGHAVKPSCCPNPPRQRNGNTLILSGTEDPATAFTCDGNPVPTTFETTMIFGSGGSVAYTTTRKAGPVPPSCPDPFLTVETGKGNRT